MASLVGRFCYVDPASALTAYYAGVPPVVGGSPVTVSTVELSAGVWTVFQRDGAGVVASYAAPVPAFPDCGLADRMADDSALAFLVIGVLVAAWAINILRRAL